MIIKYYRIYCDECGMYIGEVETSSIDKAVRLERNKNDRIKITKRVNGAYHIKCADCRKDKNGIRR